MNSFVSSHFLRIYYLIVIILMRIDVNFGAAINPTTLPPSDYANYEDDGYESTLPPIQDEDFTLSYSVNGYTVKSLGVPKLDLRTSLEDGELVIKGTIGGGGTIQKVMTQEEILWEIDPLDDKSQWILVRPPPQVDIGLIQWTKDRDTIVISGPLLASNSFEPDSDEVTSSSDTTANPTNPTRPMITN